MKNRVMLVTGSTDGIGRQSALELAALGATIVIHGRDVQRGERTVKEIRSSTGNKNVHSVTADFSSLAQVRRLAGEITERWDRLHVLINNAGVYMKNRQLTDDGFEMTFAINYLAPFLLTNLLLDLLKRSAPSRIVNVSSTVHMQGRISMDDLQGERRFGVYEAYAQSKLANVLFTYELAERLRSIGVTATCLHPGVIGTKLLRAGFAMTGGSLTEGAETIVYLASSPEVEGITGKYYQKKRPTESSPVANNLALRNALWTRSESLTGLS